MTNIKLPYKVKKKTPYTVTYTLIGFIMLAFALICLFSPFIPAFNVFSSPMQRAYMIIGGICTPFFAFVICFSILNLTSPTDGIIITEKGFTERTMADGGVGFIPADAIISLKLFGNKKKQFLGIRLENDYLDTIGKTKKAKQEISSNIQSGMPAVIIRDCDISISVKELLDTMIYVYKQKPVKKASAITEQPTEIVSIPALVEDTSSEDSNENISLQNTDNEVLSISPDDNVKEAELNTDNSSLDDLPLTVDFDADKPHITNIDELLSHIFDKKGPSQPSNE